MDYQFFNSITWFDKIGSTNDYCMKQAIDGKPEGMVFAAKFQEQGRGQRGNTWESEKDKNLMFSILLRPVFLRVDLQFQLSKVIAISICEWLNSLNVDARIKWPNDIYINDSKIAGILIENSFSSSMLNVSIVGIGINLNQTAFSSDIPNPTSLFLETKKLFTPEIELNNILSFISAKYFELKKGYDKSISDSYLNLLYRKDRYFTYSSSEGTFEARIIGVKPTGELMLETKSGIQKSYGFKEVTFVMRS